MSRPDDPTEDPLPASFSEKLAALKRAAAFCPVPARRVTPVANIEPQPGQIWQTQQFGGDPETIQESYDPFWVVLLERFDDYGELMFQAAPLFTETEMASDEDVIWPRHLLGFDCAAAIGTTITILRGSLRNCEGVLPDEWQERLLAFYRATQGPPTSIADQELSVDQRLASKAVSGVPVGLAYLDRADPAYEFHHELVERLDYLQQPVLEWSSQPAEETALQKLIAAVRAEVTGWLNIPWILQWQQKQAELYGAARADEEEKFWATAQFAAPSLNLYVSATPQGSDACSFFVSDQNGNISSALDGWFIVGANARTPVRIEEARATVAIDELVDGVVVTNPAGEALELDIFDRDQQVRDRVARHVGNIAMLADSQLAAYQSWYPSRDCLPEVLGELLCRRWLYRGEEVPAVNTAIEKLIPPALRPAYDELSLTPREKLAAQRELFRSPRFDNDSFEQKAWRYLTERIDFCLDCDGFIPVAIADSAIALPFKVRNDLAARQIFGRDGKPVAGWIAETDRLWQSLGRSFAVQLGCSLGEQADRQVLRGGSFALPILLALARGNEFPALDVLATGAVAASALQKVGSVDKKYELARRLGARLFVAPEGSRSEALPDTLILPLNEPIQDCLAKIWTEIRSRGIATTSDPRARALVRSVCSETMGRRDRSECDFTEVIADLSEGLVGRTQQLEQANGWIEAHRQDGGLLWVTGDPGAGKSAFMASIARDLSSRPNLFVVPYFFGRAAGKTLSDFCNCAVDRLAAHYDLDLTDNRKQSAHLRLQETLAKVAAQPARNEESLIFVLDGLNEATDADFTKLPLTTATRRIVWICAGLRFPSLAPVFEQAEKLGDDGDLGSLDDEDVRSWLARELQGRVMEQFGEEVWNNFARQVVRHAQGLPLFVSTIIDDVRNQSLDPAHPEAVPHGLREYYDRLCGSVDPGDGGVLLYIFSLLALAQSGGGVTEATLEYLLRNHNLRQTRSWPEVFAKALRRGAAFLRRARSSNDVEGWILYHDAFRQHLLDSRSRNPWVEVAETQWLGTCREWASCDPGMRRYALRHFATHLRLAGPSQKEELYGLARNDAFLKAQVAEFSDEPWTPLQTVRTALQAANEYRDMPEIIELSLGCARRRADTFRESPLDMPSERAKRLVKELEHRDHQLLWYLILAIEYREQTVELIRQIPDRLYHGRFDPEHQHCAIVLLSLLRRVSGIEKQWERIFRRLTPDGQQILCVLMAKQGQDQLRAARAVLRQIGDWKAQTRARREVIKALASSGDFYAAGEEVEKIVFDEQIDPGRKHKADDIRSWAQCDLVNAFAQVGDFREAWAITNTFARHQAWQKARALQYIAYAQYCRFGKETRFTQTLEKARMMIAGFRERSARDRRNKAHALAQLGAMEARVRFQSVAAKTLRTGLDMALALPPSDDQLRLLAKILWEINFAVQDNPAFSWFFESTIERLLGEFSRWDCCPTGRNDFIKLLGKFQARLGKFADAFETIRAIRGANDVRSEANGEIGAVLYNAGEPVEKLFSRLPLRSRLLVASYIAYAISLGPRPREARLIIARELRARASAQTDHSWGKPRILGALAAAFARENDAARATELFVEAARRIGKISGINSRIYSLCNLALQHVSCGEFDTARQVFLRAKEHARRKSLVSASIGAREAEAGLLVEAEATLDEVAAWLVEGNVTRADRAATAYGELVAGYVRLKRIDKAEQTLEHAFNLVSSLASAETKATVAAGVAVEAAKSAVKEESLSGWAERFIQICRETCARTKESRIVLHEPNSLSRAEAVLVAVRGDLEAGIAQARRIRSTEEQPRALRDIAMLCIEQNDYVRAFDLIASVTDDPSEMVPAVARELAARGNVDLALRLVPLAVDYFGGAYRLSDYIIRHVPAGLPDLEKTLAWFRQNESTQAR
jgi:hypothetical protein